MAAKLNFLVLGVFLLLAVFFATAINTSADTWWHLAVGRQILQTHTIPRTDTFIYGPTDKTFNSVEWLFDIVLYSFESLMGMAGVTLLRIIIGISSLWFFYKTISLFSKNPITKSFLTVLTGYMLAFRLYDRPEIASFLFLAIVNYTCLHYYLKKKIPATLYLLPATFLIWPNTHPFGIIGLAIIGFWAFLVIFDKFINKVSFPKLSFLFAAFAASAIFALVQFKKIFVFLQLGSLNSHNLTEFYSLPQRIWLSKGYDIFNQTSYDIYIYLISVTILVISLVLLLKNWRKNLILILIGGFYLALFLTPIKLYRMLPSVFLLAAPVIFLFSKNALTKIPMYTTKVVTICLTAMILIIAISIGQGRIAGIRDFAIILYRGDKPSDFRAAGVINILWNPTFPKNEPQIIAKYLNTKHLFTSTPWDEYFLFKNPDIKVFADALFYNRAQNDYNDEAAIQSGSGNWQELLKKYNIDTVVNSQPGSYWPVEVPVYKLPNWKLIYANDVAFVYARDDVIKKLPVDLSAINEGLNGPLYFEDKDADLAVKQLNDLLKFDPQNLFARVQLATYYIHKDPQKARQIAQEARSIYPRNPIFSLILAAYYGNNHQCVQAVNFANESISEAFNDDSITTEAQNIKNNCANQ